MPRTKIEDVFTLESANSEVPKPRLNKLTIRNFRCIGNTPVEIELDDIVVLVGPNNVGKSTILKAYEIAMSQGSNAGKLTIKDFPNETIAPNHYPEIELDTIVYDNSPGERWIRINGETQEKHVKERWTWREPGAAIRQGFDVVENRWSDSVPWGAPNVANSQRPQAHLIEAFENPEKQSKEITDILSTIISERVKNISSNAEGEESDYENLLLSIQQMQQKILNDSQEEIEIAEEEISKFIGEVFPGYEIKFDAKPTEDLNKTINFFDSKSDLLMGPIEGYKSSIARQGSGARRTLLWAALRFVNESEYSKKKKSGRPHVLLLDEPELCLHPSAIREACNSLYSLTESNNWQVMVTTHSPSFIDLSRDNTTIIRVDRNESSEVQSTTLFRPTKASLGSNDKINLKLLNIFDPHVAEFFFGGHTIIVEGDTEYTAIRYVVDKNPDLFKGVQVIRARGKATIVSLIKILNHFDSRYSILHDSDVPFLNKMNKDGSRMKNSAWASNQNIINEVKEHITPSKVRLLASIPNFELAYLTEEVKNEKPYNAFMKIINEPSAYEEIKLLVHALVDNELKQMPNQCVHWSEESELIDALEVHGFGAYLKA